MNKTSSLKLKHKNIMLNHNMNNQHSGPPTTRINRKIIKENALYDFYIINLQKRTDRYNNILKQFNDYDANLYFMDAFEEQIGRIGCAKSHLYLIDYAKQNNMKYIIIIEDDFSFNPLIQKDEFYNILLTVTQNYNKYDLFNGSPTFWDNRNSLDNIKKYKSFNDNYFYITGGQKLTFAIHTKTNYDKLLNNYNPTSSNNHIDQITAMNSSQICYHKYICYEIESYSNIVNQKVNYNDYIKKEETFYINLPIEKQQYKLHLSNYVIGIYSIFVNKYTKYYESFVKNINKFFYPNNKKIFFIVTDTDLPIIDGSSTIFIKKSYLGWPYETLYRYKYFLAFDKNDVSQTDIVFFFNANARCNNIINDIFDIESTYIFTIHHGYHNRNYIQTTYEKNIISTAYIPHATDLKYIGGGFFGAKTNEFYDLCVKLDNNIAIDEQHKYIACWHDESHLNWYSNIYLKNKCTFLDITYHVPEEFAYIFNKINIYYLYKNNTELDKPLSAVGGIVKEQNII